MFNFNTSHFRSGLPLFYLLSKICDYHNPEDHTYLYSSIAKRESTVQVGAPWGDAKVTRSMPPLKFIHDLATGNYMRTLIFGFTHNIFQTTIHLRYLLSWEPFD